MKRQLAFALAAVLYGGAFQADAATLDPNFSESTFATVGSQITGIAWAPDGSNRLFVSRKTGQIEIVKDGVPLGTLFATVSPVFLNNECGLVGMCFDPNFIINGYVYVFVTVSSSEQQIIRYTTVGDIGTNKTIILPGLPTLGENHDGGGLGIGPDGRIYWSIGDNGNGTGVDGNMTSLAAKVGRANLDGTVPSDNPFVDGPGGTNDYIWARGFRNPFTLTFQASTGELWVDCVGTSYEQIFLVEEGDHAGWDNFENNQPAGFITPRIKYRTGSSDVRSIAAGSGAVRNNNVVTFTTTTTHGFRQGERIDIAGVANASFNSSVFVASVTGTTTFTAAQTGADATSGGGTATTMDQGRAVSGGCFYDSTSVPAVYRGNFFYGDYVSGRLMRATFNGLNEVTSVNYFGTNLGSQIDIAVGPDGAMYWATHSGTIRRVAYTNFTSQEIIVTPTVVRMVESGAAVLTVRLAIAPPGDVEVTVAHTSGDTNISVTNGASLTFDPGNWSIPQVVQLGASPDGDSTDDVAGLTVSATGLSSQSVTVHALDVPAGPFSLEALALNPFQLRLNGELGKTYILEGSTDLLAPWTPISTNTLIGTSTNLSDADSANLPVRFYRARLSP